MIVDVKKYKLLAQVIENRMTLLLIGNSHFDIPFYLFNKYTRSTLSPIYIVPAAHEHIW